MKRIKELYELHYEAVFRYFLRMTGNWEETTGLTQETFYQACLSIFRFRKESSPKTWLFSIARNVYLKYLREKNKHKTLTLAEDLVFDEHNTQVSDLPAETVVLKEERERIEETLARLPENVRTIIILKEYEQLAYEEIAGIFGQTVNWARVAFFRAKKRFAQIYRELEGEHQ